MANVWWNLFGRPASSVRSKRPAFRRPSLNFCFELTWLIFQEDFIIFSRLQAFYVHVLCLFFKFYMVNIIAIQGDVTYASVRCLLRSVTDHLRSKWTSGPVRNAELQRTHLQIIVQPSRIMQLNIATELLMYVCLLQKYLQPLKSSENAGLVDSAVVDAMFYQVTCYNWLSWAAHSLNFWAHSSCQENPLHDVNYVHYGLWSHSNVSQLWW